ncbi:hypothetical protein [Oceanobacter mangrovi]|uniref:hypothetical protein n=1 Tax=Oceanobacter mangrovi TaxID=2862510 RepID=UPI001C8D8DE4|nr:hypothetical protein [Oceanobacter mangrovi]
MNRYSIRGLMAGLVLLAATSAQTATAEQAETPLLSCDTLISRVGLSGGLNVRVPVEVLTDRSRFTAVNLEKANADDLGAMMSNLSDVLWDDQSQGQVQWAFSDIHLDTGSEWLTLRLRPQANQLSWPEGCLSQQVSAN